MGLISAVVIPDSESLSQDEALSSSLLGFISHIGITGNVFLSTQEIATEKEVLSLGIVLSAIELTACYIGGLDIDNDELATKLLDKGARVVFFNNVDENELKMKVLSSFPRDRVGLSSLKDEVTVSTLQEVVTECREYTSHFLFRLPISNDSIVEIKAQAKVLASKGTNIQISFLLTNNETAEQAVMIGSFHEYINSVFCPIIQTTSEEPLVMKSPYSKSSIIANIDLVDAFFGCLKSDRPDGLITTVVCDDHGVCLGLVYSNKKSVEAAIFERKGIYHSRSRGGLWRKGDTSGAYQELLALSYDCDGDALRFSVIQHGEPPCFCHLNTRTCWGPSHGIQVFIYWTFLLSFIFYHN
jgi:phosphoribosyl-AMP cyclohydrolase